MATYRPSFVDVSGLTAGINRGLELVAARNRQDEQLAEARINDFLKVYQPGKLRQQDLGDFTKAYNDYKQSALMFSKLNRGGAKAEDLTSAKAQLDRSLGNLNSVYSNSSNSANKMKEYADYISIARQKGYDIPTEVTQYYNALSSTPISQLNIEQIPSANTFELVPKEIDWEGISSTLDRAGARIKEIDTVREKVPYGKDVKGNVIYADQVTKMAGRNPVSTVEMLTRLGQANPKIANTSKEDLNLLKQGLAQGSQASIDRFNEIKEYFQGVKTENDLIPEMVFGLPFYRKQSQGTTLDKTAAELQYRLIKDIENLDIQRQKGAGKEEKPGEQYPPSTIINQVIDTAQPTIKDIKQKGKVGIEFIDVSNLFAGFEMKGAEGYAVPVQKTLFVPGYTDVDPYFRVTLRDGSEEVLQPQAFNARIVSATPGITFKTGSEPIRQKSAKKATNTKKTSGAPIDDPLGIFGGKK